MNGNKKFLISSLGVVALVVLVYFLSNQQGNEPVSPPVSLDIKEYSLTGQVLEASGSRIIFNAGMVFTDRAGQTLFDYVKKTVSITSETQINEAGNRSASLELSEIQKDSEIVVYTSDNPFESDTITARRIEVK